ncbi:MAG: UDP-N-acetylmuramoyl-tripeptide--D-alanyl-D-alanine ligase, partial [Candidatus Phosphoribacter sp.]
MIALTLGEIVEAVSGRLHVPGATSGGSAGEPAEATAGDAAYGIVVDGPVVTDSREAGPGSLYIARIGEHADGHAYAAAARAAGAVAVLGSRPVPELPCIVVQDVQTAFGRLARAVLEQADAITVIGITGSSGKTSTKDLLGQVLAAAGETVAPVGSYNGEIGVPLTVCRITPTTRFLVVELGARGLGHIAYLTQIAPPRIGVVLNVGTAHVGEFGSRENIARAKGELVEALPADGVAVLNLATDFVPEMADRTRARVVGVSETEHVTGQRQPQVFARGTVLDGAGRPSFELVTPLGSAPVRLRLHGRHQVGNALAVAAAAIECGLTVRQIARELSAATLVSRWRMEVTDRPDGVRIINDAYNANPDSMSSALHALATMATDAHGQHRRTWAVLGQMLELGDDADAAHLGVGAEAVHL